MGEQMKISELHLHGTSMLYFTPVDKKYMKWNTQNGWKSVLELANDDVKLSCDSADEDYLVVDLSYTVTCKVVCTEENYYSVNDLNKNLPELQNANGEIDVQTLGMDGIKKQLDKYIKKVKETFKNIILVRMACPNVAANKYFVQRYKPEGVENYTGMVCRLEEYFISQVSPIVVDLGRFYHHDYKNRKFGIYTSYEESYYQNMKEVFQDIVVKKKDVRCYDLPNYRYILERYLTYYDKAKERNEQHLLLDRNTLLNQVVRSMNQDMIQKYQKDLCDPALQRCETYDALVERTAHKKELAEFITLVKNVMEGKVVKEQISDIFQHNYDLNLTILTITRDYYENHEYMQKHFVNRLNLKAFYGAMVAAESGEYAYAVQQVNEAIKLVDEKIKPYSGNAETREDFAHAIGYYVSQSQLIPVDVWGKFITNMIVQKPVGYYKTCVHVNSLSFTREEECREIYAKMQRSEAQWLIFDMYSLIENDPDIFEKTDEEIRASLDRFISFVEKRYGNHSYLHKITIQSFYVDADGNEVEFQGKEELEKKAAFLTRWQNYVAGKLHGHVINVGYKHQLTLDSFIVNDGINYGMDYLDEARALLRRIVHYNVKPLKVDNYINAYMNMNLGDDLFVEMLAQRYPKTQFTVFSKNKFVKRHLEKYTNLKFITEEFPSSISYCKRNITIGGSMFIEGPFWRGKYQRNLNMAQKSGRSYILGANFGPYDAPEFKEKHQELFEKCNQVSFRDSDSYQKFSAVKSVLESTDILFGSKYASKQKGEGAVISVINLRTRPRLAEYLDSYLDAIVNVCKEMIEANMPVCLMSFCNNEGDNVAIDDVLMRLEDWEREKVRTYYYDGKIQEAMDVIDSARYIVGTRFHAVVLGFLLEKCVCPIAYSNKTCNLLADLEFPKEYCRVEDMEKLSLDFVKEHENIKIPLKKLRKKAKRHFTKLDRIFKLYRYFV